MNYDPMTPFESKTIIVTVKRNKDDNYMWKNDIYTNSSVSILSTEGSNDIDTLKRILYSWVNFGTCSTAPDDIMGECQIPSTQSIDFYKEGDEAAREKYKRDRYFSTTIIEFDSFCHTRPLFDNGENNSLLSTSDQNALFEISSSRKNEYSQYAEDYSYYSSKDLGYFPSFVECDTTFDIDSGREDPYQGIIMRFSDEEYTTESATEGADNDIDRLSATSGSIDSSEIEIRGLIKNALLPVQKDKKEKSSLKERLRKMHKYYYPEKMLELRGEVKVQEFSSEKKANFLHSDKDDQSLTRNLKIGNSITVHIEDSVEINEHDSKKESSDSKQISMDKKKLSSEISSTAIAEIEKKDLVEIGKIDSLVASPSIPSLFIKEADADLIETESSDNSSDFSSKTSSSRPLMSEEEKTISYNDVSKAMTTKKKITKKNFLESKFNISSDIRSKMNMKLKVFEYNNTLAFELSLENNCNNIYEYYRQKDSLFQSQTFEDESSNSEAIIRADKYEEGDVTKRILTKDSHEFVITEADANLNIVESKDAPIPSTSFFLKNFDKYQAIPPSIINDNIIMGNQENALQFYKFFNVDKYDSTLMQHSDNYNNSLDFFGKKHLVGKKPFHQRLKLQTFEYRDIMHFELCFEDESSFSSDGSITNTDERSIDTFNKFESTNNLAQKEKEKEKEKKKRREIKLEIYDVGNYLHIELFIT